MCRNPELFGRLLIGAGANIWVYFNYQGIGGSSPVTCESHQVCFSVIIISPAFIKFIYYFGADPSPVT
jgi:hypothetical protein